ncbi:oligosaccharide flippase family protein [Vibrio sp. TH_r3]|uniref:oligosaccharide flippase family protein n=1 Tax=Vibrio sp. TH_r3 TaxID=3082084 RepID=UPI0029531FD9|nr:oligosaccharide flippase family protein [Vibrio sp. TH_r3]MDV7105997.1 oligosaccharide flippase family protein [Vibrio sp. TH_r3]
MKNKVLSNIISLYVVQGLNYLVPLLITPLLLRVLGLEIYGLYTVILAILQYVIIFLDYGFNLTATKQISLNQNSKKNTSQIFSDIMTIKLIALLIIILTVAVSLLIKTTFDLYLEMVLLGFGIVIGRTLNPVWLFQGVEKMHWIATLNGLSKLLMLILVFFLIKDEGDLDLLIIIQSAIGIIVVVSSVMLSMSKGYITLVTPSKQGMMKQLQLGKDIFISTISVSIYTTSIPLVLAFIGGVESAGIYNAADKLRQAIQSIINPISQGLFPKSNQLMVSDKRKAFIFIYKVSAFISVLIVSICLAVYAASDFIVDLLYGENMGEVVKLLGALLFIPPIVALSNMLGLQIIIPNGKSNWFKYTYILAGLIGLPMIIVGALSYSYLGVGVAAVIVELVVLSMFVFEVRRSWKNQH